MSWGDIMRDRYAKGLTVRQLIALLVALPPEQQEWTVTTEGCDCDGVAGCIKSNPPQDGSPPAVYILRT